MLIVHHLEDSRSQRILWLLEELGLDYQVRHYAREGRSGLAPDALRAVHPLGRAPVLTDGEVTVAESGAIVEYLVERYGAGWKPEAGSAALLDYRYWLHYAEGSLMPLLLLRLVFDRLSRPPVPLVLRPVAALLAAGFRSSFLTPRIEDNLDFVDAWLADHEWFAGERISGADVQMSFPVEAAATEVSAARGRPGLERWLTAVHERSAYRRALERGGPYAYGPAGGR